jgi:site-specific DNA recombinase
MGGSLEMSTGPGGTWHAFGSRMSNQASDYTRDRVKRQKLQAKEKGRLLGGPRAFGWRTGETKGSLVQDPTEVAFLSEAVDQLLAGASLNAMARRWNAQGVPTPQGRRDRKKNPDGPADWKGRWTPQTVHNVITNPRHNGLVIDQTRWQQLHELLQRRSTFAKVPRRRSLLTGVVRCSLCGTKMVRTGAVGGRKAWRCPSPSTSATACGKVSIDSEGLEQLLVESTLLHADKGDLARIIKKMGRGSEHDRLIAQLVELNQLEEDISASFSAGRWPLSAFEKATAALEAERKALTSSLARLTPASTIARYAGKPGVLRASWPTLSIDQQREIIKMLLGKIEVTPVLKRGFAKFDRKRVMIAAAS